MSTPSALHPDIPKNTLEIRDLKLEKSDKLIFSPNKMFEIIDFLGKGSYSRVYKAKNLLNNEIVALKVGHLAQHIFFNNQAESYKATQLSKLTGDGSDHLLKIKDSFSLYLPEGQVHIQVYEIMTTTLTTCLKAKSDLVKPPFSISLIQKTLKSLCSATLIMHRNYFIHGDLKPCNILVNDSLEVKVADFSNSLKTNNLVCLGHYNFQSIWYRAPEVLLENPFGRSIDMWSIGCIAAELYQGCPLFKRKNQEKMLEAISAALGPPPLYMIFNQNHTSIFINPSSEHNEFLTTPPFVEFIKNLIHNRSLKTNLNKEDSTPTFLLMDLIQKLLKISPLERINAEQALCHPFFKKDLT